MRVRFEREDGAKLSLTPKYGFFEQATEDFLPPKPLRTSMFTYSGADGGAMVKQSFDPWAIKFAGYIHKPDIASTWAVRGALAGFFKRGHYFSIIFTRDDGREMIGRNAWLSGAPEIVLRHKNECAQTYNFELTLGDPYLYDYNEDAADEKYANKVMLKRISDADASGGRWFGSGGYVYYGGGYLYEGGSIADTGTTDVFVGSLVDVAPMFSIKGKVKNVTISNFTTNQKMTFKDEIPEGKELQIDCSTGYTFMGGADLTYSVRGDTKMHMVLGLNQIHVDYEGETDDACTVFWNGVAA